MLRRAFLALPALAYSASPLRMLWAGSSSTYYHNMPKQVADWMNLYGDGARCYQSEIIGRSGDGIHVYLKPGSFEPQYGFKPGQTFLEKIAEKRYDYVALQAVARFITGPQAAEHARALEIYCKAIREAGGEPVIYEMGWEADDEAGRSRILELARDQKVRLVAPCSSAWARVRRERPDIELQNPPDRSHPGTLGHYLNLCCFFAAMSGKHPKALPLEYPVWLALSNEDKAEGDRRAAAHRSDDPYYNALPGFLRRHTLMAQPHRLDPAIAAYFQNVAWETWKGYQRQLD